jgi:hypothetical protein
MKNDINKIENEVVHTVAQENSYNTVEVDYLKQEIQDYGFVVIGPPRIGKSLLLNAVTGADLENKASIDSVTQDVTAVRRDASFYDEKTKTTYKRAVVFYDTPGIEHWGKFEDQIEFFAADKIIISYMICLAPGCFAESAKLLELAKILSEQHVYVQLIITDMYRGNRQQFTAVLDAFKDIALKCLWNKKTEEINIKERDVKITFDKGMIISVNSMEFEHEAFDIVKEQKNIQEMIEIMFTSIDKNKIAGLFTAIMNNRNFFKKAWHKVQGIVTEVMPFVNKVVDQIMYTGLRIFKNFVDDLIEQK